MAKIGVVANADKVLGDGLAELRSVLADLGHDDPPWEELAEGRAEAEALDRLVTGAGVDRLLVWGGDGTVRRTIGALVGSTDSGIEVGILPAGTSNGLAADLGIPTDLGEAARIAVECDASPLDLGVVRGEHFAVRVGIGIGAVVMRDAERSGIKDRFGRLAYVKAALANTGFRPVGAEIAVDGEPWYSGPASGIVVTNVGTLLGSLDAFPDASPTDGRLDVGVVRAGSRIEWLRLGALGMVGRFERSSLAETTSGLRVTIDLDRALPWHVDGDDEDAEAHFEVCCVPGAVRIARP